MKMLENPEKKPSDPEVMPGVIKSNTKVDDWNLSGNFEDDDIETWLF